MEEELNKLHQEKIKNEKKAKEEFDKRVKETKEKAIAENIKKAEESGNKLTQTLNEKGELVGVMETVDFESRDVANEEDREQHEKDLMEKEQQRLKDTGAANIRDEM